MRSGTTAAKDYMEVHEAMSSGSVMLTLSQKQKKLFEFKSEGREEGGGAICKANLHRRRVDSACGAVENVLRLPKLVFRPFWFVRRWWRRAGGGRYL